MELSVPSTQTPSSISQLKILQSQRVNAADKAPPQKLLRLQETRFSPTYPTPARVCWHGNPPSITPLRARAAEGLPAHLPEVQNSASSFPPPEVPIPWPCGTTVCLSVSLGHTLTPRLGCHTLAFPLPLPLSVHKLATNTIQVVLISHLEDFKGPFGRAYATAAGSRLGQAACPPLPGSCPTAPWGTHQCPRGAPTPRSAFTHSSLWPWHARREDSGCPKLGVRGEVTLLASFCTDRDPSCPPPRCGSGREGVSSGAGKDGVSLSAAP